MVVGLIRFIVEYAYTVPDCLSGLPDPRPSIVKDFHYLYFATFLFVLTGMCAIGISLITQPIDPRCVSIMHYLKPLQIQVINENRSND